jgi:hypothetical protein
MLPGRLEEAVQVCGSEGWFGGGYCGGVQTNFRVQLQTNFHLYSLPEQQSHSAMILFYIRAGSELYNIYNVKIPGDNLQSALNFFKFRSGSKMSPIYLIIKETRHRHCTTFATFTGCSVSK